MTPAEPDPAQTSQRVRVALTGLAAVFLLILVASVLFRLTAREAPVTAAGTAQADVVANLSATGGNLAAGEPLAQLGVVPAPGESNTVAPTR